MTGRMTVQSTGQVGTPADARGLPRAAWRRAAVGVVLAALAALGALGALALGAVPAAAQPVSGADLGVPPPPAPPRLDVRVGETVTRDVGIAVGYRCDDAALARIELRPTSDQSNAAVVTGLREGATLCRFGTDPYRPSIVYELRVLPRRAR